ncbi:hypothetical protein ES703_54735 [subsurface metagenome]
MNKTKTPSIVAQIVEKLYADGSMKVSQMCETIKYPYKSVYTKALELQKLGLADKDDDGVWSLAEGVTPRTLETGEIEQVRPIAEVAGGEVPPGKVAPIVRSTGAPLDQRGMFIRQMTDIGVAPKEAIPTIADIFFAGDIEDLKWLNQVLQRQAAGYVSTNQRRLMMSWWSKTRGLPYSEDEYEYEAEVEVRGKKVGAKAGKVEERPEKRLDLGVGWKIERDRDGAWITQAGGPMSYQEAVEAAERRALIDSYGRGKGEEEGEEIAGGEEGAPTRRGGKRSESLFEYMMKKMVDNMLDGGKAKGSAESETVQRLIERIDAMEKDRQEERFERVEGMIANIAARDPWEDYDKIEAMKQRLGVGAPTVTDQSPAVQLIKDSTERVDKNINRLVGIIERTALRSDEFKPEETRSPQDRETKAGQLLGEVQEREQSRALRRDVFNI